MKRRIFCAMKNTTLGKVRQIAGLLMLIAAAPLCLAQTPAAASKPPPVTAPGADPAPPLTADQISFLIGMTFGAQMHGAGVGQSDITAEGFARGVKAALAGRTPTPAEQQQVQTFVRTTMQAGITRNEAAAKEFLDRNGKEKGVMTTPSGLQYKIISAGDAKAPAIGPTDKVTVDYRGKLLDGSEFDSSFARGKPETFPVNGVIKGWQEALVMMKPGAKWQLFVPPALAYGDRSQPKIPGGSLLVFDVNVLSAVAAPKPGAPAAPPSAPPGTPGH
jgi:FKBP-type peptidyl-prolyl cis-trans isomerase FklB